MKTLLLFLGLVSTGLATIMGPVTNLEGVKNVKGFLESQEQVFLPLGKTVEEKLMFDLMKNYNKYVKPTGITNLRFSLSFICSHLDKRDFMINTRVLEKYEWLDQRLKWNPTEFNNIRKIRIPAFKIWIPDLRLLNSEKVTEVRDVDVNVVITSEGRVLYMPMVTYKTHCLTDRDIFLHEMKQQQHRGETGEFIHRGGEHRGIYGENLKSKELEQQRRQQEEKRRLWKSSSSESSSESSESSSSSSEEEIFGGRGRKGGKTDMLKCKLVLGTLTYDEKILKLTLGGGGGGTGGTGGVLDKTFYSDMCPADITDLKVNIRDNVIRDVTDEKFQTMIVNFNLIRRQHRV